MHICVSAGMWIICLHHFHTYSMKVDWLQWLFLYSRCWNQIVSSKKKFTDVYLLEVVQSKFWFTPGIFCSNFMKFDYWYHYKKINPWQQCLSTSGPHITINPQLSFCPSTNSFCYILTWHLLSTIIVNYKCSMWVKVTSLQF